MKTLTIIAATIYALLLWLFAPQNIWDKEVEKAKKNQNKITLKTPQKPLETTETTETIEDTQTTETPLETPLEITKTPKIETAAKPQTWTVKELRKIAQERRIKWKDENGKPLNKTELMRVLEV